nr:MAG TPA: hypothetical protein [Caudoviricetes sp.]
MRGANLSFLTKGQKMDASSICDIVLGVSGVMAGVIAAWFARLTWSHGKSLERPQISSLSASFKEGRLFCRIHVQPGTVFDIVTALKVPGLKMAFATSKYPECYPDEAVQQSAYVEEVPLAVELEPGMGHKSLYFIFERVPDDAFDVVASTKSHGEVSFRVGQSIVDDWQHKKALSMRSSGCEGFR